MYLPAVGLLYNVTDESRRRYLSREFVASFSFFFLFYWARERLIGANQRAILRANRVKWLFESFYYND